MTLKAWWRMGYPLLQKIPDVNEPTSGYLWGESGCAWQDLLPLRRIHLDDLLRCEEARIRRRGRCWRGRTARSRRLRRARRLPAEWGGGVNKWPWPIPLMATNTATKPELVGHFAAEAPDFNLRIPDQIRVDIFLRHLKGWIADQRGGQGHDAELRDAAAAQRPHRGNDGRAGRRRSLRWPTTIWRWGARWRRFRIRLSGTIRRSSFWKTMRRMAADHVDAHRSMALVVSKYAPHGDGWRGVCRQPFLFDGERGADDGDAARAAADE